MRREKENGRRNRAGGFTLVEVVVVLVVLAILAAILFPTLTGYIRKADERAALAQARALVTAAQALASEQYGSGDFAPSSFLPANEDAILRLAELEGYADVVSISFREDSAALRLLSCVIDSYSILYDADGDPKYSLTDSVFSRNAAGFYGFSQQAAATDKSVTTANGNDKKAKALQALFVEEYGDARGLSADEAALFTAIGTSKNAGNFQWLPTYAANGDILLIATDHTYASNKSNYNASLIYYNGTYYYYYANKYQPLGSAYVGDRDFDVSRLTGASTEPNPSADGQWIKLENQI